MIGIISFYRSKVNSAIETHGNGLLCSESRIPMRFMSGPGGPPSALRGICTIPPSGSGRTAEDRLRH